MKYAREILSLMPAYPGRQWKMEELVRGALLRDPSSRRERDTARQGVLRLLKTLEDSGQVHRITYSDNSVRYVWGKVRHEVGLNSYSVVHSAT